MQWKQLEQSFVLRDYLKQRHYDTAAIESAEKQEVLILPGLPGESREPPPAEAGSEDFVPSAADIRKILERQGIRTTLVADPGLRKREIVRKAADIWLPAIVVVGNAALTLALSILANWIFDRYGRPSGRDDDGDHVHFEIIELRAPDTVARRVYISGPANALVKGLRSEARKRSKRKK